MIGEMHWAGWIIRGLVQVCGIASEGVRWPRTRS